MGNSYFLMEYCSIHYKWFIREHSLIIFNYNHNEPWMSMIKTSHEDLSEDHENLTSSPHQLQLPPTKCRRDFVRSSSWRSWMKYFEWYYSTIWPGIIIIPFINLARGEMALLTEPVFFSFFFFHFCLLFFYMICWHLLIRVTFKVILTQLINSTDGTCSNLVLKTEKKTYVLKLWASPFLCLQIEIVQLWTSKKPDSQWQKTDSCLDKKVIQRTIKITIISTLNFSLQLPVYFTNVFLLSTLT